MIGKLTFNSIEMKKGMIENMRVEFVSLPWPLSMGWPGV